MVKLPDRCPTALENAVPISVLAYIAIVGKALQDRPPHVESVHASLGFVEHLSVHADQNGVWDTPLPIRAEGFYRVSGIAPTEQKVSIDGMLFLEEGENELFF